MRMSRMLLISGAVALGSWLMGRPKRGTAERAGRKVDEAAEKAKEAMSDIGTPPTSTTF